MYRLGSGAPACLDQRMGMPIAAGSLGRSNAHGQIGLAHVEAAGIGVRIDGDRAQAELARAAQDPQCDFSAVGDKQCVKAHVTLR
ncbi:hypothetical protein D3C80_2060310 [compost metagenome]